MHRVASLLIAVAATSVASVPAKDSVPVFFIANSGQVSPAVKFIARGSGLTAYLSIGEAQFRVRNTNIRVKFEGASDRQDIEGADALGGRANFLVGSQAQWRRDLRLYGAVVYNNLYPGIDLRYSSHGRDLKSEFLVHPGADPGRIRMRYSATGPIRLAKSGALRIPVDGEIVEERAPLAFQERGGPRSPVAGRFAQNGDGTVGFALGEYDSRYLLVIDPELSYSTLLGGSSAEAVTAVAVDASGAAYVAGFTSSYDFPSISPIQSRGGGNDVFVAKFKADGSGLVYCTYLGGIADDRAYGIAVDSTGSAYVSGATTSRNFPLRNALQTRLSGAQNAFLVKLNPSGNGLIYATYLGGNGSDAAYGIVLEGSGSVYLIGDTTSSNFPATGVQKSNAGGRDAFVCKVNADGSHLLYSSFLGGGGDEHGAAIAVDSSGTAYVAGSTFATDFPVIHAVQANNGGGQDAFVSRFSADGSSLLFSTYLGGEGGNISLPESAQGIALDAAGKVLVTGVTASKAFPLKNPLQGSLSGGTDTFVAKLDGTGVLLYSTYLGGSGQEVGTSIAGSPDGTAVVVGYGYSSDLPVTGDALQKTGGGDYDAFVAKLSSAGDKLVYLSYLGGNGSDVANAVAVDPSGNLYLAGWTLSMNFPLANAYQKTNVGGYGGFLSKLRLVNPSAPSPVSVSPNAGFGTRQTFSFVFSDSAGTADLSSLWAWITPAYGSATASTCMLYYDRQSGQINLLNDSGSAWSSGPAGTSGTLQNSQCGIDLSGVAAGINGNTLILNVPANFTSSYAGSKEIWMYATAASTNSGWQRLGIWTVPAPPVVSVVAATPNNGAGSSQSFSFVFSDTAGALDLTSVSVWITPVYSSNTVSTCMIYYDRPNGLVELLNDAATAWSTGTPGSTATLQNSQCSIGLTATSTTLAGNNLTLTVAMTFSAAYVGAKQIWMYGVSAAANSGWRNLGSWTVAVPTSPITALTVTPSTGSGSTQTFTLVFADTKGAADLTSVWGWVKPSSTSSSTSSCEFYYDRASAQLRILNDLATSWIGGYIGTNKVLSNRQCSINLLGATAVLNGTRLTMTVPLSFTSAYRGQQQFWVYAMGSAGNSGWQQLGNWVVP